MAADFFVTLGNDTKQLPETLGQKTSAASLSVVIASDASLPISLTNDTDYGAPGANTLRTAAMLGVGSTAVSNANPVPVSDAGGSITVDGTVAATQSGTWNITNVSGTVSLPTGAATEATLAAASAKLPATLGQKAKAASLAVTLASDQDALPITDNGGSITVDGTVAATQSGTWNITNVSGTVSLPTGAATETTLAALNTKTVTQTLGSQAAGSGLAVTVSTRHEAVGTPLAAQLSNGTSALAYDSGASSTATLRTVLATRHESASTPISVRLSNGSSFASPAQAGRAYSDSVRKDYSSGSVTTGAWTQLIASTAAAINSMMIFDSSGQTLELGIGGSGSETRLCIVPPGGFAGPVPIAIAASTRLSVKAISATADSGELNITGLS